ncbi:MAG: hypothetical protein Q8K11_14695 [Phenylobacterium sp.]|uniref:hypothetical protein n=1 Tax=Phenylobacterium sp. TaxID=1871053 RepID=UPI00273169A7|nr:hypothetical protein [Phenylobacterium sp.]MDP2011417.1 hypothetical protein [Phenylobacterium sp.]
MKRDVRWIGLTVLLAVPQSHAAAAAASPGACAVLKAHAEAVLEATADLTSGTGSHPGQADAAGCVIAFKGTGEVFGTRFQVVAARLDAMMVAQGWTQDINAAADGPTGSAMGYRKGSQAVAVSVDYDTPSGVCRDDAPVASCHPTAAQMIYSITLGLTPAS